ncbi:MAG: hypothetical protein K2X34_05350 [Hyphomonadaceae bacterium]|nr:hypothetical protein [Hyphomonadaceae bacterium]
MTDIENLAPNENETRAVEADPYASIRPLVRLLARQAAREDYARALEAARVKPYSTQRVRGATEAIEET